MLCVYPESITIATSFLISRDVDTHYRMNDTAHFQFELDDFHIEKSRLTFLNAIREGEKGENALATPHGSVPMHFVHHCRTMRHVRTYMLYGVHIRTEFVHSSVWTEHIHVVCVCHWELENNIQVRSLPHTRACLPTFVCLYILNERHWSISDQKLNDENGNVQKIAIYAVMVCTLLLLFFLLRTCTRSSSSSSQASNY